jgi:diguanylate cyclase (GGDEF)-like protein/PAS domain S-box-containing protein
MLAALDLLTLFTALAGALGGVAVALALVDRSTRAVPFMRVLTAGYATLAANVAVLAVLLLPEARPPDLAARDRLAAATLLGGVIVIVAGPFGLVAAATRRLLAAKEETERRLAASEERYRSLLESAPDAMVVADGGGRIVLVNAQAERLLGYSRWELEGETIELLVPERFRDVHEAHRAGFFEARDPGGNPGSRPMGFAGQILFVRRKDGDELPVEISLSPLTSAGDRLVVSAIRDVSGRMKTEEDLRRSEARLRHLFETLRTEALHDTLTGLANRALFEDHLELALAAARRDGGRGDGGSVAVVFIDLDGFKAINDRLGHLAGDSLLTQVARRLRSGVRSVDTVARWGGDEFALVLPDVGGKAHAEAVVAKLRDRLRAPFRWKQAPLEISASLGLSVYPEEGDTAARLIERADAAMYADKRGWTGIRAPLRTAAGSRPRSPAGD